MGLLSHIGYALVLAALFAFVLKVRLRAAVAALADSTHTDPLTGLPNRQGFQERLDQELERARRTSRPLGLLICDVDRFKRVNDELGQAGGDALLAEIARVLNDCKRQIDIAGRIGGGEFALLVPESDEHGAYLLAERIRHAVRSQQPDGRPITISFGAASFPVHGEERDTLLRAAEQAVSAAKELGRDRTVIHSSEVAGILESSRPHIDEHGDVHLITALSLAEALDLRDTGTARHARTVGRYAEMTATALGLEPARVERVRLAGILHDIGKIAVSDAIVQKPGPLTEEEWLEMRRHSEIGAQMLGASALRDIREWVLAHHERPDGRGYPNGLAGELIPIEARILAVADAYEAMTTDRPYRDALDPAIAREELIAGQGTQFDTAVVDAFLAALAERDELQPRSGRSG